MKLYEFYKKDHGMGAPEHHPSLELIGTKHQYLPQGLVVFHSLELEATLDISGTVVEPATSVEYEHFISYHAFDRLEITEVKDE